MILGGKSTKKLVELGGNRGVFEEFRGTRSQLIPCQFWAAGGWSAASAWWRDATASNGRHGLHASIHLEIIQVLGKGFLDHQNREEGEAHA
ncbi:MAG: hypothetical protein RLZZ519_1665, partial [Bacteroidota bacterium]